MGFLKKWVYLPVITVWSGIIGGYAYQGHQTYQAYTTFQVTQSDLDTQHPHLRDTSKALSKDERKLKYTDFATPEMAAATFQTEMSGLQEVIAGHVKASGVIPTEANQAIDLLDQSKQLRVLTPEQELKTLKILEDLKDDNVDLSGALTTWLKEVNPNQLTQEQQAQLVEKIRQFEQERQQVDEEYTQTQQTAANQYVLMLLMGIFSPLSFLLLGPLSTELTRKLKKQQLKQESGESAS
jgi:hypothetical protein